MSTVDVLVIFAAFLMLAWALEFDRAERALEENAGLRADLEATGLSDEEWERLLVEASRDAELVAWVNGGTT